MASVDVGLVAEAELNGSYVPDFTGSVGRPRHRSHQHLPVFVDQ